MLALSGRPVGQIRASVVFLSLLSVLGAVAAAPAPLDTPLNSTSLSATERAAVTKRNPQANSQVGEEPSQPYALDRIKVKRQGNPWWQPTKLLPDQTVSMALEHYKQLLGVEAVEPVYLTSLPAEAAPWNYSKPATSLRYKRGDSSRRSPAGATPNDDSLGNQWWIGRISAQLAWLREKCSRRVLVGVADSGVDAQHQDLAANVHPLKGWDAVNQINGTSDGFGHGTRVAGVLGAVGNNDKGYAGVCWTTSILACKIFDDQGNGNEEHAMACIRWLVEHGVKVIVASWHFIDAGQGLKDTIAEAGRRGTLVVCAAGNGLGVGKNLRDAPVYPAAWAEELPNLLVVAATGNDESDALTPRSNYGMAHIGAPGEFIPTLEIGDGYGMRNGTSYAAPLVAGAAAAVLSHAGHDIRPEILIEIIMKSADKKPALKGKVASGGRLNMNAALDVYKAMRDFKPPTGRCATKPRLRCRPKCDQWLKCEWVPKQGKPQVYSRKWVPGESKKAGDGAHDAAHPLDP